MRAWNERAYLKRWQLALLLFLLFLIAGLAIAGVLRAFQIQRETQANRISAIEGLCRRDNMNARKNKVFIHAVSPKLDPLAQRIFTETPSCHAFAVRAVKPDPGQVP